MELLEIEKELKGPGKEAALTRYDEVLVMLQERLEEALRVGLTPDEFEKCQPLGEAIVVARKLLRLQVKESD